MITGKHIVIIFSDLTIDKHAPEIKKTLNQLASQALVIYATFPNTSWLKRLFSPRPQNKYKTESTFKQKIYSMPIYLPLPMIRLPFISAANRFLMEHFFNIYFFLLLRIALNYDQDSKTLTFWLFQDKFYPYIRYFHRQNIVMDTLDYVIKKPQSLGKFWLAYKATAVIYSNPKASEASTKNMQVIHWGANLNQRLKDTVNAIIMFNTANPRHARSEK